MGAGTGAEVGLTGADVGLTGACVGLMGADVGLTGAGGAGVGLTGARVGGDGLVLPPPPLPSSPQFPNSNVARESLKLVKSTCLLPL